MFWAVAIADSVNHDALYAAVVAAVASITCALIAFFAVRGIRRNRQVMTTQMDTSNGEEDKPGEPLGQVVRGMADTLSIVVDGQKQHSLRLNHISDRVDQTGEKLEVHLEEVRKLQPLVDLGWETLQERKIKGR